MLPIKDDAGLQPWQDPQDLIAKFKDIAQKKQADYIAANYGDPVGVGAGYGGGAGTDLGFNWSYSGPSAEQMAAADYAAQYALLDKLRGQTTQRYTAAGNEMGGAYDALSAAMRGEMAGMKADATRTGQVIGGAYNDALNKTNSQFAKSRSAVADLANSMGVSEALAGTVADSRKEQDWLTGLTANAGANSVGLAQQLGQNAQDYQRWSADTSRLAGTNMRADFKAKMQEALSGLDMKKLDIKGQETQAKNQYAMQILKMKQDAEQSAAESAYRAQRDAIADEFKRAGLELDKSRLGLDTDKFNASLNDTPAAKESTDPFARLAMYASQLYPGAGTNTISNAVSAVADTYTRGYNGDRVWTDAGDFANDVLRRNQGARDADQLRNMAIQFYTDIIKNNGNRGIGSLLGGN